MREFQYFTICHSERVFPNTSLWQVTIEESRFSPNREVPNFVISFVKRAHSADEDRSPAYASTETRPFDSLRAEHSFCSWLLRPLRERTTKLSTSRSSHFLAADLNRFKQLDKRFGKLGDAFLFKLIGHGLVARSPAPQRA